MRLSPAKSAAQSGEYPAKPEEGGVSPPGKCKTPPSVPGEATPAWNRARVGLMRVVVDLTRCQGYAQCAFLAPGVFRMRGEEALMYDLNPNDGQRERVLSAAAACPVQAILVDRLETLDAPRRPEARRAGSRNGEMLEHVRRIVIVGASLAGLEAAETLRHEGFTGSLTVIGDEPSEPYDRPPLSKQVLSGSLDAEHTALPESRELDVEWQLGQPATGLDLTGKQVRLADGQEVGFDRLLIATGARARPWPNEAEAALDGVFVVHTREDASRLRQRLAAGPRPGRVHRTRPARPRPGTPSGDEALRAAPRPWSDRRLATLVCRGRHRPHRQFWGQEPGGHRRRLRISVPGDGDLPILGVPREDEPRFHRMGRRNLRGHRSHARPGP